MQKYNLFFLLLSLLIALGCSSSGSSSDQAQNEGTNSITNSDTNAQAQTAQSSAPQTYKGLLYLSPRQQWLRLCDQPNEYFLLKDQTGTLINQYNQNKPKLLYPNEPVIATLTGQKLLSDTLKPPYTALLKVSSVDKVVQKNHKNSCIPYEYWALGNEPYWSLEISAREGLMVFKTLATVEAHQFPYAFPKKSDGKTVYETQKIIAGQTQKLKAVIKEQACSDSMSDTEYSYSIEVKWQGRTYKGCAVQGEIIDQSEKAQFKIKK